MQNQPAHIPSNSGVRIDACNIYKTVWVQEHKHHILHPASLSIMPGELVAVTGHSGSGKSTLLQILNGRTLASGQIYLDHYPLKQIKQHYRTLISYIPQHHILHRTLTVEKALYYTGRLRLPLETSTAAIEERITIALQMMELAHLPDIRQKTIHTLSNGEQLRVSIAAELLSGPRIFLLDEPTSGLDPLLGRKIVTGLRRLADSGHTIIFNTHVTADLDLCDQVIFLSDGYMTYFGPPRQAPGFFRVENYVDIYPQLDKRGAEWYHHYHAPWNLLYQELIIERQKDLEQTSIETLPAPPVVTGEEHFSQSNYLARRMFELIRVDRFALTILLLVMPVIAICMALLSDNHTLIGLPVPPANEPYIPWRTAETRLVIMALAGVFLGTFAAAHELIKERTIFLHEAMINLKIGAYIGSKMIVLIGFAMVQCFSFLLILGINIAYPSDGTLFPGSIELFITLLLTVIASLSLGLLISSIANSMNGVMYITMLILFFQIIFSGAIFSLDGLSESLSYLTISRWSLDGLGTTVNMEQLGFNTYFCTSSSCEQVVVPVSRMAVNYGYEFGHLTMTWCVLLGFSAIYTTLTYLILRHRVQQ